MRSNIFEVKPSVKRQKLLGHEAEPRPKTTRSRRNSKLQDRVKLLEARPLATPGPGPTMATRSVRPQQQAATAHTQPQPWTAEKESLRPIRHEIAPPRKWSHDELEDAIQKIIMTLEDARKNSHPEMFSRIWDAQMARLVEYEQYEKQQADMPTPVNGTSTQQNTYLADQEDGTSLEHTEDEDVDIFDTDANADADSSMKKDTDWIDLLRPDQTTPSTHQIIHPTATHPPTTNHQQPHLPTLPLTSHLSPHHPSSTFPLTAYIPPSLPIILTAYITPFSTSTSTSTTLLQPYIWPDAPVDSTSYTPFLRGIRLRANVPDSIPNEKLALVLAYSWSDTCRVVRGEGDWVVVMTDIKAAARSGVEVWRVKICCVGLE